MERKMRDVQITEQYYDERSGEYESTAPYMRGTQASVSAAVKARYQLAFEGHDVLELACGPGYWTEAVALTARSIVATDYNGSLVALARKRLVEFTNVRCEVSDAYVLDNVKGPFNAAFANFWWSHVPKAKLDGWLSTLNSKLEPGSLIMFIDSLRYYHSGIRRLNEDGDLLEDRVLLNGNRFEIIKNFPTEEEILGALSSKATDINYSRFESDGYWTVSYRTLGHDDECH
jgi:protein-L-isoaspartate O-methyltransferase